MLKTNVAANAAKPFVDGSMSGPVRPGPRQMMPAQHAAGSPKPAELILNAVLVQRPKPPEQVFTVPGNRMLSHRYETLSVHADESEVFVRLSPGYREASSPNHTNACARRSVKLEEVTSPQTFRSGVHVAVPDVQGLSWAQLKQAESRPPV